MDLNIADDYFKAMQENDKLRSELEKRNRDLYEVKHELAKLQTEVAHLKKGDTAEVIDSEESKTIGGMFDGKRVE